MCKQNKFGKKLAYYLSLIGLSQRQLADKLGTTQQSVSRWINGTTEPDIDDILYICYYLGVDPNELLGFEEFVESESDRHGN